MILLEFELDFVGYIAFFGELKKYFSKNLKKALNFQCYMIHKNNNKQK